MDGRRTAGALGGVFLLLLAGFLALVGGAQASSPNYQITGCVDQPGGSGPVPAGIGVQLIDEATHQTFSGSTSAGGRFSFTSGSTAGVLSPGWWAINVPAQAHLRLSGSPYQSTVYPASSAPTVGYWTAANLSSNTCSAADTIANVSILLSSSTLSGTVRDAFGSPVGNAAISLSTYAGNGFVLNNTTSNSTTGAYSFRVPQGLFLLQSIEPGATPLYNYSIANVLSTSLTIDPVIQTYLARGFVYDVANGHRVPNGGNVTVIDETYGTAYTQPMVPGFYAVGIYSGRFSAVVGNGEKFLILVSPVGYQTIGYTITVSSTAPFAFNRDVSTPAIPPAGSFNTTLTFSPRFGVVNISTTEHWGNNSVLPDLSNASVSQLWEQLGMDAGAGNYRVGFGFAGGVVPVAQAALIELQGAGPFLPAGQSSLKVNGSTFGQAANATFTTSGIPAATLNYSSPNSVWTNWTQAANVTSAIPGGGMGHQYTIAFNFRHPIGSQSIAYTLNLPSGYTLGANTQKPIDTQLLPAGPGGTWTSFTLRSLSLPGGSSTYGTANFTVVKYSAFTAIVNISVANFAFSSKNVLNGTRANYTVVVGAGENVTFSAANSTYPDGTNGTQFLWAFGDAATRTTATPSTYHTYAAAGIYAGSVNITSSGGRMSQANFNVLAGNSTPIAVITSNATAAEQLTVGGIPYLLVNSSTPLRFNITGSSAPLGTAPPRNGVLSVAAWNTTSPGFTGAPSPSANYTAGSGLPVNSNYSVLFLGAGRYLSNGFVGTNLVAFLGWQYNISLSLWDGSGRHATAVLPVLVRDHVKPKPVITIQNSAGKNVTSIVEAANGTAGISFLSKYSLDPTNGSIVTFNWLVNDTGNTSIHIHYEQNATAPSYANPGGFSRWLRPQVNSYTVNLTVTDRAGNVAWTTLSLTVSVNGSTRPVLSVTNLTAPSSMNEGTTYTIWGNVTNTVGKNSTAVNVSVEFYLLSSSGSGSRIDLVSSSQVQFYNYTKGVVASSSMATGVLRSLPYNTPVRAQISWNPGRVGTYSLVLNATCANEFAGNYGPNTESVQVTLNPNPTTQLLTDVAIVAAVVAVLILLALWWRRRRLGPSEKKAKSAGAGTTKSGLERGTTKDEDEEE